MLLTYLRSSELAVPFHRRILVIGLGLIAWVEAALPGESFESRSDRVPRIEAPSKLHRPGGVVPTVRAGDLLFTAVSINSSPGGWWLVDSGATMCEFDLETANRKLQTLLPSGNRRNNADLVSRLDLGGSIFQETDVFIVNKHVNKTTDIIFLVADAFL